VLTPELIIPDVHGPDVRSAVRWLQEHLPFSDDYLAQLVGVSTELFSEMEGRRADADRLTDANAGKSFTGNKPIVVILRFSA
jgi:hypothetical protein